MRKYLFILMLFISTSVSAGTITMPQYGTGDTLTADNLNTRWNLNTNTLNGGLDNNNADVDDGFRFIEIVSSLPAAGTQGRVVFNTDDNLLYFDTGSEFVVSLVYSGTAANGDLTYFKTDTWNLLTSAVQGNVIYYDGTDWVHLTKDTSSERYISNTGTDNNPIWDQVDVVGGLSITGGKQGDIFFASSPTSVARLEPGTSGQILVTAGVGADPAWLSNVNYFDSDETTFMAVANGLTSLDLSPIHNAVTLTSMTVAELKEGSDCRGPTTCLDFDGSADFYSIADNSFLDSWTELTFEVWMFKDTTGVESIFDNTTGAFQFDFRDSTMDLLLDLSGTDVSEAFTHGLSSNGTGQWVHIVLVFDTLTSVTLYINGSVADSVSEGSGTLVAMSGGMKIGVDDSGSGSFFEGRISGVRFLNRALTATEISDRYNSFK